VLSLGSGAALLAAIIAKASLRVALLTSIVMWIAFAVVIAVRADSSDRKDIRRLAAFGAIAGFAALIGYDGSRWAVSHLEALTYNPFEAIRVFGLLLTGAPVATRGVFAAGFAYHVLNGAAFGMAYALFFARRQSKLSRAVVTGVLWGVGLELFQVSIYPGWLDIRAYNEFLTVSFIGHVVYGFLLGIGTRWLLERGRPGASAAPPTFSYLHSE
jgi:hypothetical protein